jgi:protein TonB
VTPVAPVVVENVQMVPETPPPEPLPRVDESTPSPDDPGPAADLDLPPLPQVQPIAAVPSSVPVAFGLGVKGAVRLVSDAANASGAVGGRRNAEPVALDFEAEHNLLLPPIAYPPRAKRQRITGTALIEFRTSPTGEISGVRVRESSGHAILDQAAQENLQAGRWTGPPGYFVKAYEFTLQ